MVKSKSAAETAIALDASLSEAYCSLATYYLDFEYNFPEAKKNFLRSIELDPEYEQSRSWYGMLFLAFGEGKFDEAVEQGEIAIKLEPLSAIAHADLAWTLYTASRFEDALAVAKMGVELDNSSFLSLRLTGLAYMGLHRYEESINALNHLVKISQRHQHAVASLIWALCSNGDYKEATKEMTDLTSRSATEYLAGTHLGLCAAYLNDFDKAFEYLEKAYEDCDPMLMQLRHSPVVPTSLRDDSRFQNLLTRIGFPG
jgi:tetratricopeptide (TPR) repeat protein